MRDIRSLDARDRLIVALDLPTVEAADAMVRRIGPAANFYKIGLQLLFAGGIHDRLSAAMVAAMAAPLAARGVKVGVLMGTAYLFTEEAVSSASAVNTRPCFRNRLR